MALTKTYVIDDLIDWLRVLDPSNKTAIMSVLIRHGYDIVSDNLQVFLSQSCIQVDQAVQQVKELHHSLI